MACACAPAGLHDGNLYGLPFLGTDAVPYGYQAAGAVYLCVQRGYEAGGEGPPGFHDSMLPMGLIQGRAPSNPEADYIHLFFVLIFSCCWSITGVREIRIYWKRYRADVDSILEYYDRHLGPQGLVENLGYWDFVDWQESWHDTMGRPSGGAEKALPPLLT